MFPVSATALLVIALALVFAVAAATMVRQRFRLWIYLPVALAFCYAALAPCEAYGCPALAVAVFAGAAAVALAAGQAWGWIVRLLSTRFAPGRASALPVLLLPSLAASIVALERQYVADDCRGSLPVEIAGVAVEIASTDGALLRWQPGGSGERFLRFAPGRDTKDDVARLCRLAQSEDGIAAHRIDFGAPGLAPCATEACRRSEPPRHALEQVSPDTPHKPVAWFGDATRADIRQSGTVIDGWICFLPSGSVTWLNCTRWISPAPGLRAEARVDRPGDRPPETVISELDQSLAAFLDRLRARGADL